MLQRISQGQPWGAPMATMKIAKVNILGKEIPLNMVMGLDIKNLDIAIYGDLQ